MMTLDSGTVAPRCSSRSTGNLPIGQSFSNSARSASLPKSIRRGVNLVSFS